MGGATSGRFSVKPCGKAHAWCKVCRPDQAAAQRVRLRSSEILAASPCRKCGKCNNCIGISAPDGYKVCRACRKALPVEQFPARNKDGKLRNQCRECKGGVQVRERCDQCGRVFFRQRGVPRTVCSPCAAKVPRECLRCGQSFMVSLAARRYCSARCQQDQLAEQTADRRRSDRMEALRAYGGDRPSCACCGESCLIFLALDHINGGGHRHRKETGGGGFYIWLRRNGYPAVFRILCHNCNMGRQLNGGVCPHEESRNDRAIGGVIT